MNHCPCGAKLTDDRLHREIGAAFYPTSPEACGGIVVRRLLVHDNILITCSWNVGLGDMLDLDPEMKSLSLPLRGEPLLARDLMPDDELE
jgi:hypothetical protein